MDNLLIPWAIEIGVIVWRDFRKASKGGKLPLPSEFLSTFVVFGSLTLVSQASPKVATTAGYGFVVATLLTSFTESSNGISQIIFPGSSTAVDTTTSSKKGSSNG
jgi:hypothetical protein